MISDPAQQVTSLCGREDWGNHATQRIWDLRPIKQPKQGARSQAPEIEYYGSLRLSALLLLPPFGNGTICLPEREGYQRLCPLLWEFPLHELLCWTT
jgi:hypothetical protein